jgi:hypothetical protein
VRRQENSSFANFGCVSVCAVCKCAVLCVGCSFLYFSLQNYHCRFFFMLVGNVLAICAWAWFQTSCGFISLNAWFKVKRDPQYAVDATTGVYSSVVCSFLFCFYLNYWKPFINLKYSICQNRC